MYTEITCFRTLDGCVFETAERATNHVMDNIRQELSDYLMGLVQAGRLTATDVYKIVMEITTDSPDTVFDRIEKLAKIAGVVK
jgi:hypothetical protein